MRVGCWGSVGPGTGEDREGRASLFGGIVASVAEAEGCWPPSMASEENPAAPPPCDPQLLPPSPRGRVTWPCLQRDPISESMRHPQSRFPSCSCSSLRPYPILGQPLLQGPAQRSPEDASFPKTGSSQAWVRCAVAGPARASRGSGPTAHAHPIPSSCSSMNL